MYSAIHVPFAAQLIRHAYPLVYYISCCVLQLSHRFLLFDLTRSRMGSSSAVPFVWASSLRVCVHCTPHAASPPCVAPQEAENLLLSVSALERTTVICNRNTVYDHARQHLVMGSNTVPSKLWSSTELTGALPSCRPWLVPCASSRLAQRFPGAQFCGIISQLPTKTYLIIRDLTFCQVHVATTLVS